MFNTIYRLIAPWRFKICFENLSLNTEKILVRPTYLSICNADQRYYQGLRTPEVLMKKLPMALIHEGIGVVLQDFNGFYSCGERVVMIPNEPIETDKLISGNYLRTSRFRGSGMDGFLQENLLLDSSRLIKLPDNLDNQVAAITEFVSISIHAINRLQKKSHNRRQVVGVWGDGNLGFVTALLLKYLIPGAYIVVIGVSRSRLEKFTFANETLLTTEVSYEAKIDHAFECVGGIHSQDAINQIIDCIQPEGTISILGVSEYSVSLNTRMILEKGITLFGSSRSEREDFEKVLELYQEHREIPLYLQNIINQQIDVRFIEDIYKAFEADIHKEYGKTIIKWNI